MSGQPWRLEKRLPIKSVVNRKMERSSCLAVVIIASSPIYLYTFSSFFKHYLLLCFFKNRAWVEGVVGIIAWVFLRYGHWGINGFCLCAFEGWVYY